MTPKTTQRLEDPEVDVHHTPTLSEKDSGTTHFRLPVGSRWNLSEEGASGSRGGTKEGETRRGVVEVSGGHLFPSDLPEVVTWVTLAKRDSHSGTRQ